MGSLGTDRKVRTAGIGSTFYSRVPSLAGDCLVGAWSCPRNPLGAWFELRPGCFASAWLAAGRVIGARLAVGRVNGARLAAGCVVGAWSCRPKAGSVRGSPRTDGHFGRKKHAPTTRPLRKARTAGLFGHGPYTQSMEALRAA